MSPPRPPSPPSGPPLGTNFSRRKLTQPRPPFPACAKTLIRSTNMARETAIRRTRCHPRRALEPKKRRLPSRPPIIKAVWFPALYSERDRRSLHIGSRLRKASRPTNDYGDRELVGRAPSSTKAKRRLALKLSSATPQPWRDFPGRRIWLLFIP